MSTILKKLLSAALIGAAFSGAAHAGFSLGMTGAFKKQVVKLDAKVAREKAALLLAQTPSVPTNLTAVAVSTSQINLAWTASTDDIAVTSYKIYRDGGAAPIAAPTGTSYSNTGLVSSTTYSYAVSACDAAGNCSAQSTAVSATTGDSQPTVPTNLTAVSVSISQVNLSWTASVDDVGVTSYKIYRDGGVTPIAAPAGTSYSNTGLISSTTYSYAVSACDGAGNCSAQSTAVSTTTADAPPTVPTNLTAVALSSSQIHLGWTASADDIGVTSYKIYRDGGASPIAAPAGTGYTDTGRTAGTTYSYTVSACDAAGNCSGLSVADSTTTPLSSAGGEWILVPGNAGLGTPSDFYVMKYEAKLVIGEATSQADLTPWTGITLAASSVACSAVGAHLLTIPETQTINRNIEALAANWANGEKGSLVSAGGGLKRGNVGLTDSAGYTLTSPAGPDYVGTASAGSDRTSASKAKLVLSNESEIWDWSGNVDEWVYGAGTNGTLGTPGGFTFDSTGAQWSSTSSPDLSQERPVLGPSNSGWNTNYGVGFYWAGASTTKQLSRGGNSSMGANAGVFAFRADFSTSDALPTIGFRCAR